MQPADVKKSPVRGERPPRRTKTPEEAYAALTHLCARAEKSESDALRLMRGWGLAESDAQRVLARLVSDRFIDDARYAGAFVREKFRLSGWGEYKIRAALQRKGIARERIDAALAEADRGDTAGRLRRQLERKARTVRHATPCELKAKLVRYGLSLGYEYEAVLDAASEMTKNTEPADYVYPVLDVSRLYAANFGELRPAHFHAGIDIKTDGVEGKPLVAVADGYVSRVSLAAGGYGRAIYLTLDNGTTAVYGHLQRFRDDIEKRVREERYRNRSNGADLRFDAAEWPVRQGDTIGFSGNSGSSMGPHLHFELRDTPTQRLRNVVREGVIRPEDDLPPRIMRLHYIEVDTLDGIPVHRRPVSYAVVREAEGRYRLTREEPVGTGRKGYFVAEVTDRRNGVHNTFGVWRVSLAVDGEPRFEYRMDGFTHDLSRCCDAVSCYPMQLGSRNEAIRLARMERSPACFYPVAEERGIVRTAPGEVRRVRIEAEDDCGNRSALEFDIRGRADTFRAKADPAATALRPERTSTLRIGRTAHVTVPAGALYEPLFVRPEIRTAPEAPEGVVVLSPAYRFLDCTTPLRLAATAEIRADIPRPLQLRTLLAVRNRHGRLSAAGGRCNNGIVRAATRSTGDFVVVADTLPPRVRPLFERGADLSRAEGLRFGAGDNFSGIAAWSLEIDGQWVPCDRFPIKGTLVHFFDTPPARSRHTVRLSVTDACGNTTRCETEFVR